MKYADKIGAQFTTVLGDSELESGSARLKNMKTGDEIAVKLDDLSDELFSALNKAALESLSESLE